MCATCGCSGSGRFVRVSAQPVGRLEPLRSARLQRLEHAVLDKNERLAAQNRALFEARRLVVLNVMSSPGSGKTTLLERTIERLGARGADRIAVIQGDQATERDAERVRRAGASAVQINTGQGCHLDASMIERALSQLELRDGSLLVIENVGNLVCPAMFDLGEAHRVALLSVTEGDDKPLKYPHMFRSSDLVIVNKLDLLEHCDFDLAACRANIVAMNPHAEVLTLSARRGDGMDAWIAWLDRALSRASDAAVRAQRVEAPR